MLSSVGINGAVDWWFGYKLPTDPKTPSGMKEASPALDGFNYIYCDASQTALGLAPQLIGDALSASSATLKAIFDAARGVDSTAGWVVYNDEVPNTSKNNEERGHCKGVLAFDQASDSGVWLLHSTPRYPVPGDPGFPDDEKIYAQTFLCVTLADFATAERIAGVLRRQNDPQVYGTSVPKGLTASSELANLANNVQISPAADPADIAFKSRAGTDFRLLAKSRKWGKDFWIDLVGPALGADFEIETWRRGKVPGEEDSDTRHDVHDVDGISLSPIKVPAAWHYTKDHAKWAASVEGDWVCVADINRQISQEKRGGGAICFQHKALHSALRSIETKLND